MPTPLSRLFFELTQGASSDGNAFILNSGDLGLLRSLERLTAADASASSNGGATVAAHAQHLRFGFSLMNRWAREGGNPFANAKWDEAWKISTVDDAEWREIRDGLRSEVERWAEALEKPLKGSEVDAGVISSVAHLAYHIGAIRQISRSARGPKEGTFKS